MATRRNHQWLHVAIQALLFFTATEAVTLSQFQQISPDQIPSNCLSVYTSAIAGCVEADFTTGASCSAKCAQGITAKESNLQNFCAGIQVNPKSLIGIALGGSLLGLLCPLPIATSTPPIATSTKIPGFTTIPFPTTTTKDPIDAPPTTTRTTTAATTTTTDPKVTSKPPSPPVASPPPPPSTTIVQTPTLVPPPSSSDSDDIETSTLTSIPIPAPPTTTVTPPSATNINPPPAPVDPPAVNDQTPQPIEQNGSPFANINFAGAGNSICAPSTTRMIWLSFAVGLILRLL